MSRLRRRLRHAPAALLRRSLQLGVLIFVAYAAVGGIWRNYKVAHNNARLVKLMHGEQWADLYATNEDLLERWNPDSFDASLDFLGMPWAATAFGVETADPILVLSTMTSTWSVPAGLLGSGLLAVALAVLMGKVFCSHLCPMRLSFEVGQWIRGGLLWLRVPLPHVRADSYRLGGAVLVGGLIAAAFTGMGVWFFLLPYLDLVAAMFMGITAGTVAGLLYIPLALWMTDVLIAPGMFCRNVCPQGFLLENLGRFSLFRLVKRPTKPCPGPCRACTMVCPYGLSPRDQTHRPICDSCGKCVPVCPTNALRRRVRLPIVAAVLAVFALPAIADAHHNKGLPHYGYFENYPQVPTEEVIIVDGRWEMGATIFNFQGYERKDADTPNDVKIFVYLYDLEEDRAYLGPASFDIVFDGEVVSSFTREKVDEEVVYSTRETLPESGSYEIVAHIPDHSTHPRLPFVIDLEEDAVDWFLVAALVGPLIPLFILAALGRSRRGRSELMRDTPTAAEASS